MKLRDFLGDISVVFAMHDSKLARAIKAEFKNDLKRCKMFINDDESAIYECNKREYDIAIIDVSTMEHIYNIDEIRYANPLLEIVVIGDIDLDRIILQCFKRRIFAFVHKSSFFAPVSQDDELVCKICSPKSPYSMRALESILAHIALLRRNHEIIHITPRIAIESASEMIFLDEKPVFLSPKLKKIFWLLYANANRIVPYDDIIASIFYNEGRIDSLRMAVLRIRKMLDDEKVIKNVLGQGYMLVCDTTPQTHENNASRLGRGITDDAMNALDYVL